MEEFRVIKGFENIGRIKQIKNERILPQYLENKKNRPDNNYMRVNIKNNNEIFKTKRVHQLVAYAFLDNPLNLPVVHHKDENKLNNNISNLEYTTYSKNAIMSKTRKSKYGKYITKCKQNRWYVRIIRKIEGKKKCLFSVSKCATKFTLEDMVKIRDNYINNL